MRLSSLLILSCSASPMSPPACLTSALHALRSEDASSLDGAPPHALPPCEVLTALDVVSCSQTAAASAGLYLDALVTVAKTPPPRWWAGNAEGAWIQSMGCTLCTSVLACFRGSGRGFESGEGEVLALVCVGGYDGEG